MNDSYYKIAKLTQPRWVETIEKMMSRPGMTPNTVKKAIGFVNPQMAALAKRVAEYIQQRDKNA
jgi:hypothetical protein